MEHPAHLQTKAPLKTRIAPTPSGYLHLGNVLSFAITWALARQQQGELVLRIDDIDNERVRSAYVEDIFETLDFLGIDYDEGPIDAPDFYRHYSQHHRLDLYNNTLDQLAQQRLVYACLYSRTQIKVRSAKGDYPLTCRSRQLALDTPNSAWRLLIPEDTTIAFQDLLLGETTVPLFNKMPDFVVRRKNKLPSYQVASFCDDVLMGINTIVRGSDLLTSTAAQLFIARQTGTATFAAINFIHHPLIQEENGNKLSKSHGSLSINQMRRNGLKAADIWQTLGNLLGWQENPITDSNTFLQRFKLEDVKLKAATLPTAF
ncbi:glutamate--tRNA ligase family protein [Pontibacter sp. SGAir0037]|uniref:glutamate--tRNA ligase family protein n=1 Tax=Pontibacter sp. SGAir0037 TaxID=2571030 RepID=UPI0010CD5A2E|nr:glutamate--tRNA ligase family protein [Pontibacter sp. SGAir0037]QCR23723.1 tRNA glutamyl-Q synthetase [Pontibacter sp. SGAir0037]